MRLVHAYLVLVDISGYTRFVTDRTLTLTHAEQIITDLINAVIDQARHPLILNKLEGDAALLYREAASDDVDAGRDVMSQVRSFFPAFEDCAKRLREDRRNCGCDACKSIDSLSLKAFVHLGEFAIKQVRQFEELAGEPVILLHRLMKNAVESHKYVLMTSAAADGAKLQKSVMQAHVEDVDGFGPQALWLTDSQHLPESHTTASPATMPTAASSRSNHYRHLPHVETSLWKTVRGWFGKGTSCPDA
ncbi:MAG: DUF2652 domain-containing protein [Rudaea sp.]